MPTSGLLTGIHSKVLEDGEWVALDYDYLTFQQVKEEARKLRDEYMLSDLYISESSACRYHLTAFTLLNPDTVTEIVEEARADRGHQLIREERGNSTIRVSKKADWDQPPEPIAMIPSPYYWRENQLLKSLYFKLLHEEAKTRVDPVEMELV